MPGRVDRERGPRLLLVMVEMERPGKGHASWIRMHERLDVPKPEDLLSGFC
jgi:hypothetical protein